MTKERDVIVIGSGLAGVSAAMHAAYVGLKVLALTKPDDSGYWARVNKMRDFPGAFENASGFEIIKKTKEKAEITGAAFQDFEATSIKTTGTGTFQITDSDSQSYEAPALIIASGVSKDEHFLAGERKLVGKGVFYSVQNDGPALKHQSAMIIGKSEEAVEAALYLAKFAERIYFIIPSSKLDISENIHKDLESQKKIELFFSSSIKKLNGTDDLHSVTILSAGSERELKTRSAFIYTYNLKPCTTFAKDVVKIDDKSGRILVGPDLSTSETGIFACGDVLCGSLQNPAVSIAQGMIAAINAEKFLRS